MLLSTVKDSQIKYRPSLDSRNLRNRWITSIVRSSVNKRLLLRLWILKRDTVFYSLNSEDRTCFTVSGQRGWKRVDLCYYLGSLLRSLSSSWDFEPSFFSSTKPRVLISWLCYRPVECKGVGSPLRLDRKELETWSLALSGPSDEGKK